MDPVKSFFFISTTLSMTMLEKILFWLGWRFSELGFFLMNPTHYLDMRDDYEYVIDAVMLLIFTHTVSILLGAYLNRQKPPKDNKILDDNSDHKLRVVYVHPPNTRKLHSTFILELKGKEAHIYKRDVIHKAYMDHKPLTIDEKQWFVVTTHKMCDGVSDVYYVQPIT